MDRNPLSQLNLQRWSVALRKESVDRNSFALVLVCCVVLSLSARRAWIEIIMNEELILDEQSRSPQGERG